MVQIAGPTSSLQSCSQSPISSQANNESLRNSRPLNGLLEFESEFFMPTTVINGPRPGIRTNQFRLRQGSALSVTIQRTGQFLEDSRVHVFAAIHRKDHLELIEHLQLLNYVKSDFYEKLKISRTGKYINATQQQIKITERVIKFIKDRNIVFYVYSGTFTLSILTIYMQGSIVYVP
jgi:hypothetical protein